MQKFLDGMLKVVKTLNENLSNYVLVVLLIGVGLFFTVKTRFVQIRCFGQGMKNVFGKLKLKGEKQLNYNIVYWDKNKILIKIKNTIPFEHSSVSGAKIVVLSNADKVIITQSYGLTKTLTTLS